MKTILEKGETYEAQCSAIRQRVSEFAQLHSCESIPRGRHGHASLACHVGSITGIIDIQMDLIDWNAMPDHIPDEYPFELWCAASMEQGLYSLDNIHWGLPFRQVETHLDRFLAVCWDFLTQLKESDFTDELPAPSISPDLMPNLGGPKLRMFQQKEHGYHGAKLNDHGC